MVDSAFAEDENGGEVEKVENENNKKLKALAPFALNITEKKRPDTIKISVPQDESKEQNIFASCIGCVDPTYDDEMDEGVQMYK